MEDEVPRMKTTPSQQRFEQAVQVFVGDLERYEGALLKFQEALLELEEGAHKEGAPEHQNWPEPTAALPLRRSARSWGQRER